MKRGFTLIELLVVIAIIGILATVVVINLVNSQKKARDSRRKSDLAEIVKAVQLYKLEKNSIKITWKDTGTGIEYCTGNSVDIDCANLSQNRSRGWFNRQYDPGLGYDHSIANGLISHGIIAQAPVDPINKNLLEYMYSWYSDGRYVAMARLESPADVDSNQLDDSSCPHIYSAYAAEPYLMNYCAEGN